MPTFFYGQVIFCYSRGVRIGNGIISSNRSRRRAKRIRERTPNHYPSRIERKFHFHLGKWRKKEDGDDDKWGRSRQIWISLFFWIYNMDRSLYMDPLSSVLHFWLQGVETRLVKSTLWSCMVKKRQTRNKLYNKITKTVQEMFLVTKQTIWIKAH